MSDLTEDKQAADQEKPSSKQKRNLDRRKARERRENERDRYAHLYDYAPVGYITLDKEGNVLELNRTAARLLNQECANIIGKPFADWLVPGEAGPFYLHLEQACSSESNAVIRTKILAAEKVCDVRLETLLSSDTKGIDQCRMVMTDITLSVQTERRTKKLLQENRRLTRRLFSVQEIERRHLSRELHDELGQWLTAIQAEAQAIRCKSGICAACPEYPKVCSKCRESAQAIVSSADQMHQVVRRILQRLRPVVLDQLGLADSLEDLVGQWRFNHPDVGCELTLEGALDNLNEITNITLYRTVQEALTNISSHADARQARIGLRRETDHILLSVSDDGLGMDMHLPSLGMGLLGMRERAIAADGEFCLTSKPGQGLCIDLKLPLILSEPQE